MAKTERRTLDEYVRYLPWLERLGFGEEELRSVPVYENADTEGDLLALGSVSPGAPPAAPGELEAAGTRQLFVYKSDTPPALWGRLRAAVHRPERSGYPKEDMFTGLPDVTITDED